MNMRNLLKLIMFLFITFLVVSFNGITLAKSKKNGPPKQAKALAEALIRYMEDPDLRKCHAKAGRERIKTDFNFKNYIDTLIQHYSR